jgi:hypothetical protein
MEFGLFCSVKIFSITFNTFRCIYLFIGTGEYFQIAPKKVWSNWCPNIPVAAKWPWPDIRTDSRLPGQKCFYERLHRPPPTRSGRWDTASPTTLPENKWRWRCFSSRRWSGLECPRDSCRSKKVLVLVTAWLSRWKVFLLSGLKLENPFALSILFTIYLQFFSLLFFPVVPVEVYIKSMLVQELNRNKVRSRCIFQVGSINANNNW